MNSARTLVLSASFAVLLAAGQRPVSAGFPLPDHVLHGTIVIGSQPVTRADTDVIIEARRTPGAPPIASYRMGTRSRLGTHLYELRLELEEAPASTHRSFALGDSVHITVRNRLGTQYQVVHQISDTGVAQRLDFGGPVDSRGVGIPDDWQFAHLGALVSDPAADTDGDGVSHHAEYLAGTIPVDAADTFRLALMTDNSGLLVAFRTLIAAGPGYQGRQRYYALEAASDPAGPWEPIPNHSRIPGTGQLLVYRQPEDAGTVLFYRARVWLE